MSQPTRVWWIVPVLAMSVVTGAWAQSPSRGLVDPELWYGVDAEEAPVVRLHVFWSPQCGHCLEALPFVFDLAESTPWLELVSHSLVGNPDAAQLYIDMAWSLGEVARFVPAFLFCEQMMTGWDSAEASGARLRQQLMACHERLSGGGVSAQPAASPAEVISVPILGEVEANTLSLPLTTLVIAGLDAFNPCAFFVLLFLLSLLVNTRSRARMLLVAGIFVFFSGLVYFLFMAAWLNVFLVVGQLQLITVLAGIVAVVMAGFNIKDFFWFQRGPSLSIPESAKPSLFRRMRRLVGGTRLPTLVLGTVVLAAAANSYELLCTAGFPMVYTRVLTLSALPTGSYYLYLVFYNVVYVLPLCVIVAVFVVTLGRRKLQEDEGRALKLLSGTMMLGLGLVLLIRPGAMNNLLVALGLLGAALLVSGTAFVIERSRHASPRRHGGPTRSDAG